MLTVRGLRKRFGSRQVLDGVDITLPAGRIFGFVGANGAGKSTTMRAIMGLTRPDAGEVCWDGEPLDRQTRQRFGYLPEERGLYQKMTVVGQVEYFGRLYGLSATRARRSAERWVERLDLTQHRDATVQSLSLGNQQRVQVAVCLVHDPVLLVLDEPFSGLDPFGVQALSEVLMEKRAEGLPVLFSSHQLDVVERLVDAVGVIRDGTMRLAGDAGTGLAPRLRVQVTGGAAGWADGLPGHVMSTERADTVLVDPEGAPADDVLRAAIAVGSVQHFGWDSPSLTELFTELFTEEVA